MEKVVWRKGDGEVWLVEGERGIQREGSPGGVDADS